MEFISKSDLIEVMAVKDELCEKRPLELFIIFGIKLNIVESSNLWCRTFLVMTNI